MENSIGLICSYDVVIDTIRSEGEQKIIDTPFGKVKVNFYNIMNSQVCHITRSSMSSKHIPPHKINHRANIFALKKLGVKEIISTGMVGSLNETLKPGELVLMDQFLDFRKNGNITIFDDDNFSFTDVTELYCTRMRNIILEIARKNNLPIKNTGCYVCVNGPRFETCAEVKMFHLLGGDVIGMTNLPECFFARELGMCYSTIGGVVNFAAGIEKKQILASDFNCYRKALSKKMADIILNYINSFPNDTSKTEECSCSFCYREEHQGEKIC